MIHESDNSSVVYERKFAEFIRMCEATRPGDVIAVVTPHTLGDTYEEIIESRDRLSAYELRLTIASPQQRNQGRKSS
jgi:hypothetical protein